MPGLLPHVDPTGLCTGRLQNENVLAPDVLHDLDHHLAIAELADFGAAQLRAHLSRDFFRELRVGAAGKYRQIVKSHASAPFTRLERRSLQADARPNHNVGGNDCTGLLGTNMAGEVGIEPTNAGIKIRCLTTWRLPKKRQSPKGCFFNPRATNPWCSGFSC